MSTDVPVPHPKNNKFSITPLLRHSKQTFKPIMSTTISVYMNDISRLFVPKGVRSLKLCTLGSTLAARASVPILDIMVQGNWLLDLVQDPNVNREEVLMHLTQLINDVN
ncbi:hypothetical protein BGW39_006260 [Mortierella sp. 14UC]|nr:hypothetical protein BGW39_006260 [Mortierella sp. 14UC]